MEGTYDWQPRYVPLKWILFACYCSASEMWMLILVLHRFQGWSVHLCFWQPQVHWHWAVAGWFWIVSNSFLLSRWQRQLVMPASSIYRLNQVLCLTTSSSLTTLHWLRNLQRIPGASTRRFVFLFVTTITDHYLMVDPACTNYDEFWQAEKAAFDEAEKKKEEEVIFLTHKTFCAEG